MIGGEDVLFRPINRGHYRYTDLVDGTLDLADVMLCNEAIDIENENERRAHVHQKQQEN